MPTPFGFSIGDFIAGICLLQKSLGAIKDSTGSVAALEQLNSELYNLENAIQTVNLLLEEGDIAADQRKPIELAVKACQRCIDDFLHHISQYQRHLRRENNGWRSSYLKIKWALCRQDDVAKFRSMLILHAHPITILLAAHQSKAMQALAKTIQDDDEATKPGIEYEEQVQKMSYMLKDLVVGQRKSQKLVDDHHRVSMSKFEALQASLQSRNTVPAQVMLREPIILRDACGRFAPFHLEFVDSLEAFVAVMFIRFKQVGVSETGLRRLTNLEFTLRDTRRKQPVDLTKPWCSTLKPGQHIDMNMLYPTITYQMARLSIRRRQLLCYNFWFPCLVKSKTIPPSTMKALIGPEPDALSTLEPRYDRLEEFERVHLILQCDKSSKAEKSVPIETEALTNFMESIAGAFSIGTQHLVVTVDSKVTIDADLLGFESDDSVRTMKKSFRMDYASRKEELRLSLPSSWDGEDSEVLN